LGLRRLCLRLRVEGAGREIKIPTSREGREKWGTRHPAVPFPIGVSQNQVSQDPHFSKGVFFRRGLLAAPFLFMRENNDNSGVGRAREVIDLQAVADDTNKRMGEAVEAAFLARVCRLRIPVCKPWGDSERYDFVVDWGKGFWRVQVKGGSYCEGSKYQAGAGGNGKPFTKEDMDFVVVHVVPLDVWYVIPIERAEGLVKLWFNPGSTRARFEKISGGLVLAGLSAEEAGARGYSDCVPKCGS
jgi:hypothetical protein